MFAQPAHQWRRAACAEPLHETLHAGFDDRFGLRHCALAHIHAFLHHAAQIIDGVEIDIGEAAGFRFDVTWHRKINHEHRAALALFQGAFNQTEAENRQRTGGARDDDVEFVQLMRQIAETNRAALQPGCQPLRALHRAVCHADRERALRGEVGGGKIDHLAGADEQHVRLVERGKDARCQTHTGRGHGY